MKEFEEIYCKYSQTVYKYVLSLGADDSLSQDITADTFLKAMKSIKSYDSSCKMSTWLCTIARNTYFSYLRKKDNNNYSLSDDYISLQREENSPESIVEGEETRELIYRSISKLSSPYKDVVYLKLFADLSYSEIGKIFDKNEAWARVTYYRSRNMLKGMIENEI